MEAKVMNNILDYNLIDNGDIVVIGVSGGPDSMALLYILLKIQKTIDFQIIIAHVNHGVREEALRDELFVEEKAKELSIPYYSRTVDMIGYAKEKGITEEEAGRELRYKFFREILIDKGKGKIAVAHNMDDQGETLLMRIIRGTGIDGLKGMNFIQGDIIRPILNINRKDIEEYIENEDIETVLDKTNLMPIYTRNKIRLELIPYIEENFNPNLIDALWRLSQTTLLDSNFLEKYSKEEYNKILKSENKNSIILRLDEFNKRDISIRNRIIRIAIETLIGNLQGLSKTHISSLIKLFQSKETGKEVHLPRDIIGKVDYESIEIYKKEEVYHKDFIYQLELGDNNFSDIRYKIKLKIRSIEDISLSNIKKNIKYFDYDKIKGKIYIRNRRDGDRLVPFGMEGRKKLKDYFIDEKISKDLRDNIPLLVDEKSIIWVIGYRTSNLYKIDSNTKRVLIVEYKQYN